MIVPIATAAVPALDDLVRGLDRLPPIFRHCTSSRSPKTLRPSVVGDFAYATNGHLCVRVTTPAGWDVADPAEFVADPTGVFRGPFSPDPVALPIVDVAPCPRCAGACFVAAGPCLACSGRGDVAADCPCPRCPGSHLCDECEGSGTIPAGHCPRCGGVGFDRDPSERAEVSPGVFLAGRYVALLRHHGAIVFLPTSSDPADYGISDGKLAPIRFVVGDVEGRLMPTIAPEPSP